MSAVRAGLAEYSEVRLASSCVNVGLTKESVMTIIGFYVRGTGCVLCSEVCIVWREGWTGWVLCFEAFGSGVSIELVLYSIVMH